MDKIHDSPRDGEMKLVATDSVGFVAHAVGAAAEPQTQKWYQRFELPVNCRISNLADRVYKADVTAFFVPTPLLFLSKSLARIAVMILESALPLARSPAQGHTVSHLRLVSSDFITGWLIPARPVIRFSRCLTSIFTPVQS
jgi:hypothetical protein